MKTAEDLYNNKYPRHTRLLKVWVIELMEEYASQFKSDEKETIYYDNGKCKMTGAKCEGSFLKASPICKKCRPSKFKSNQP